MNKVLHFQTDCGPVLIELLDTELTKLWYNHFINTVEQYPLGLQPVGWPYYRLAEPGEAETIVDIIMDSIDKINMLSYASPLPETVTRSELLQLDLTTQQTLNRLHRYAVVGTEFRNRWLENGPATFDWVDYNNDNEFMYLLNLLNQKIHALEDLVRTPHRHDFYQLVNTMEIRMLASKYEDVTVYQEGTDLDIPDSMHPHLRLSGYDVWIKKDLLGKDYITAFADHDDPTQFDVRPPPMTSGGLHIDLNQCRDKLYREPEFINWLGQTPTDQHGNYPLGYVIFGKHNLYQAQTIKYMGLKVITDRGPLNG
jgi:hypothetical protein